MKNFTKRIVKCDKVTIFNLVYCNYFLIFISRKVTKEQIESLFRLSEWIPRNEKFASTSRKANFERNENVICPEFRIQKRWLISLI